MGQVEDQGEWERCRSTRRMFLSLVNGGRRSQLEDVARGLLRMAHKRLPDDLDVHSAQEYWDNGLRDDKNKEMADRVYLVIRYVVDALRKLPNQAWAGGGEVLVCTAIRILIPLAPPGFRHVGKLEGNPSLASLSARIEPHRLSG